MQAEIITGDQVNEEKIDKPFLTHSIMQSFLGCPAEMYMDNVMKIDAPRNFALGFGSAWDQGLNDYAERKMSGDLHMDDVKQVYLDNYRLETHEAFVADKDLFTKGQLEKIIEKHGEIPDDIREEKKIEHKDFWRKWGLQKIGDYHQQVGQYIEPIATQQKFFIDFGPSVPFGYKGTIDRIDKGGIVVDNKTSKGRWKEKDLLYDLQGVGYSLAYRVMNKGKVEKRVQFDIMVKTKTQKFEEQFQQLVIGVEEFKFDLFLQELSNVYRMLSEGMFFRRVHKFTGSCSWCPQKKHCWQPSNMWSKPGEPPKLANFYEIGQEFKKQVQENPKILQFWY